MIPPLAGGRGSFVLRLVRHLDRRTGRSRIQVHPHASRSRPPRGGVKTMATVHALGKPHAGVPRLVATSALLLLLVANGCVERRYTIRSDPPGALAIVNGEEIGPTPVSRPFTYYGDRRIQLQREGYEPLNVVQPIDAPWYDNLFTEFFTENLIPYTFRDERDYTYRLQETRPTDAADLLREGDAMRAQGQTIPPPRSGGLRAFLGLE
ncbi:MAG: PEGA domain-containing protein [Isosphaeraceae bacterium]|nr:PEGA domain-containing protein [Isosphaeraceae bacterium]